MVFWILVNEDDEEFNLIQPTLIQQLKTILDQYPDDGQILKVRNVKDLMKPRYLFTERYSFYPSSIFVFWVISEVGTI